MFRFAIFICATLWLTLDAPATRASDAVVEQPVTRSADPADETPKARWDHRPRGAEWTRSALEALSGHGAPLVNSVPRDIAEWCPGYPSADAAQRRAFWVGFLSALSKHESTYRASAVGGGGLWFGLLQILPGTAQSYGCNARTGNALTDGGNNLSCAIRIMARTVTRDGAIALKEGRWRGVAADWAPVRSEDKRADMESWLRQQSYCAITKSPRPPERPKSNVLLSSASNTR